MPDGGSSACGAAGLNDDDEGDGDECEDGFHNLPFARRGFFGRMFFSSAQKKAKRRGCVKLAGGASEDDARIDTFTPRAARD